MTHAAVSAVARALLLGLVLVARTPEGDVSVGCGQLIDWRRVRCGDDLPAGQGSAADFAMLFVELVGDAAALEAVRRKAPHLAPRSLLARLGVDL